MGKELLENQWVQAKEFLHDKWSNLTDEDIRQIDGNYDQLITKLQQRYGYTRQQAEDEIRKSGYDKIGKTFSQEKPISYRQVKDDDFSRRREAETPSVWRWLLPGLLGLALLGAFLSYESPKTDTTTTTSTTTQGTFITPTAADQMITQNIFRAFNQSPVLAPVLARDGNAIRIDTLNGIVTISGTVSSAQERDAIVSAAQNVNGVQQIINRVEVR